MKTKKSPWKSGNSFLLSLFGFDGLFLAVCFIGFVLFDPSDYAATLLFILGLVIFGVCFFLGIANWIIEKKVNEKLMWLGYVKPFETNFNLVDDVEDPIISLSFKGQYVSRHNDKRYLVDLVSIVLGVSFYLFRNPNDNEANFCIVYNRYGLGNQKYKAYSRVS